MAACIILICTFLGKTINQISPYYIGSLAFTVHECHQMVCLWICICLLYPFETLVLVPILLQGIYAVISVANAELRIMFFLLKHT
jgi:hypothetical protein